MRWDGPARRLRKKIEQTQCEAIAFGLAPIHEKTLSCDTAPRLSRGAHSHTIAADRWQSAALRHVPTLDAWQAFVQTVLNASLLQRVAVRDTRARAGLGHVVAAENVHDTVERLVAAAAHAIVEQHAHGVVNAYVLAVCLLYTSDAADE